jgi:hypothetical protein
MYFDRSFNAFTGVSTHSGWNSDDLRLDAVDCIRLPILDNL